MKRLLILVPAFPEDESTSYTVPFIQQFLLAFSERYEIKLEVISLYVPIGDAFIWHTLNVIPLNGTMEANLIKKGVFIFKAVRKIKKMLRKKKYDGILSFWYGETAIIGNAVSSGLPIKHYTWLQGQDVKRKNKYMRFIRQKPDKVIALSEYQNQYLYQEFGFRAQKVASVAINPSFFPPLNQGERPIDLLAAGSLIALKNHKLFLEVVLELKKRKSNLTVVLVGNGPLEEEYKNFVQENKLENTVTFTGLKTHRETLEYMNMSKIFLHTSKFEGGGMVCFESLYSGCYLISTLPIVTNSYENFSHLQSKQEIVAKIHDLLNNNLTNADRYIETSMDHTCEVIYKLFY